ncbi:hypothetical protein F4819DRAFT_193552 [Hypoxylon fuscum]|nr:hypothetical protein F4819DRAFT_193552 [Hypoxylon fuscum]
MCMQICVCKYVYANMCMQICVCKYAYIFAYSYLFPDSRTVSAKSRSLRLRWLITVALGCLATILLGNTV